MRDPGSPTAVARTRRPTQYYWTIAGRHHASHWRRDVCLHLRAQVRREADHLEPAGPGDPHTRLQHQEGVFVHGPPTYIVHIRILNRKRDRSYPRECLHGSVLALPRGLLCGPSMDNVQTLSRPHQKEGVWPEIYIYIYMYSKAIYTVC